MADYQKNYHRLVSKLNLTRRKELTYFVFTGLLFALSATVIASLILSSIEYFANGDIAFRSALFGVNAFILIVSLVYFQLPAIRDIAQNRSVNTFEKTALRVGEKYPAIKDRLCNVIQLIPKLNSPYITSNQLALAAFDTTYTAVNPLDFNEIIDRKNIKRSLLLFFAISTLTASLMFAFTGLNESFGRIVNFNQSFIPACPFVLDIEPKDEIVLKGDHSKIKIIASGIKIPDYLTLYVKEKKQKNFNSYRINRDSINEFSFELKSMRESISFYAETDWFASKIKTITGKITVTDRPLVKSIAGKVSYPRYTGKGTTYFDELSADLSALKGAIVHIEAISGKEVESAEIIMESIVESESETDSVSSQIDTNLVNLSVDGKSVSGSFRVTKDLVYYIRLTDSEGNENSNPIKYTLTSLTDDYPSIGLIEPQFDVTIKENALLFIKTAISDDYGFSNLLLKYRLAESEYAPAEEKFQSVRIPILTSELSSEVPYVWDLNRLEISPSDKYEFYLEIYDNDIVSGPKSARTRSVTVRLPSLDEVLRETDYQQNQVENELAKVLKDAQEVREQMDDLNRDLLKKGKQKELDWKEKKKATDIMNKQAELAKKVENIQKQVGKIADALQEKQAISPETLQKYMELQSLLEEVNSQELKQLQKQMKAAMNKMTPEQMQKAMKEFKFDEEKFRKGIERTLKILKRLQAEQKADALHKRAEDLAKEQDELAKQTENASPNDKKKRDELAKKQDKLKKDLNNISEDLSDLEKLMKEIGGKMPMDELQKAKDALDKNETSSKMSESQKSLSSGQMQQSMKSQKSASKNLKDFAKQMENLKNEMNNEVSKEAMRKMQKAISDMLELSKQQESLKNQTKSTDRNSTQFPDLTEGQSMVFDALRNVANEMVMLSQKSFAVTPQMGESIGNAMDQMQTAMSQLTDRNTSSASKMQQQAMGSMNQSIMQMQSMMSMMKKGGSGQCDNPGGSGEGQGQGSSPGQGGQGLSQKLQQAAAQQQAIGQMLEQMAGGRGQLSKEQQAKLGRMVDEQGKAQKAVQELAEEQRAHGKGDKLKVAKLAEASEDMKEMVRDMRSGHINRKTLQRQERILSRLLDATRSVHDRDYEKKRESQSGLNFLRAGPDRVKLHDQEGTTRKFEEFIKSIQKGYSKDYEELIKQYFESVKKAEVNGHSSN